MIIATPIDLPKIEPDNWDTFWDMWNTHAENLVKVNPNVTTSLAKLGASNFWKGFDIFKQPHGFTSWSAPFVDIKESLPKLYNTCSTLPIENVYRVRLITSLQNILSHTDDSVDKWSIRAYFHYTDLRSQWYFTKPHDINGTRQYLHLPNETNWFAYNDKHCWHGTDYNPDCPKILLQVFSSRNNLSLVNNSIEKYKDYTITLNEQ